MAQRTDIRYVRLYTDGTAARKLDVARPAAKTTLPRKAKKQKKIILHVDPIAILGTITAMVMLVIMVVSMFMLRDAENRATAMEQRVEKVLMENQELQKEYESGYDLEQVERTALALGMVPKAEVQHVKLHVQVPQVQTPDTAWDQFVAFLTGLFA